MELDRDPIPQAPIFMALIFMPTQRMKVDLWSMDSAVVGVLLLLVGDETTVLQIIRGEVLELAVRDEDIRWEDIIGAMEMHAPHHSGQEDLTIASMHMLSLCDEVS